MLDFFKGIGLAGAAGALLGFVAVTVIAPVTPGGVAILMAIPILICSVVGGIFKLVRGGKGKKDDKDDKDDKKDKEDKEDKDGSSKDDD
ncbi:hypothetical protein [Bradyrhizobium sp. UFLA05-112]